jgi:hypothetical protein
MMLQLAEPEYARIVRRDLYGELFRRREPGPDVQVWAAANSFGGGIASGVRAWRSLPRLADQFKRGRPRCAWRT